MHQRFPVIEEIMIERSRVTRRTGCRSALPWRTSGATFVVSVLTVDNNTRANPTPSARLLPAVRAAAPSSGRRVARAGRGTTQLTQPPEGSAHRRTRLESIRRNLDQVDNMH
ncbi:hypothetical protein EVAR_95778_1 [Eumeta japonica]|uniref:Uncharacterized protein n=1 Tax=Eumeta variegata TaxID=151549 RepID=A0A4C1ULY8_EUMVA|nr:hypothetical protein EVAR_95778_1 [Eumeta japonica]